MTAHDQQVDIIVDQLLDIKWQLVKILWLDSNAGSRHAYHLFSSEYPMRDDNYGSTNLLYFECGMELPFHDLKASPNSKSLDLINVCLECATLIRENSERYGMRISGNTHVEIKS
jgi:hypothetical protein